MHGRLASCAAFCALLLLIPVGAARADNDDFADAKPLPLGVTDYSVSNAGASIQPGETLTENGDADHNACVRNLDSTMFSRAGATMWWVVTGTGRPITVTTAGSSFDTHLGIFSGGLDGAADCQDGAPTEALTFASAAGVQYRVQVGGCVYSQPTPCTSGPTGQIHVLATSPPPANDARGAAAALPSGQIVTGDNYAAAPEETGEATSCGGQPYGRTVWYRWTASSTGTVAFNVSGAGTTVAAFGQTGTPLGCQVASGGGARLVLGVTRGDVLVQVAGIGARAGLSSDSTQGRFTLQADFTETTDRDGDGIPNGSDCKPDDARVHPGLRDVPRNGVDEDCNGRDAPYPSITSRAALGVALFSAYSKVTSVTARDVPAGARVQLRCSGRSCPFRRTRARTIHRKRASVSLMTSALRAKRILPTTTFEVRVTGAGHIGRVMRFAFKKLRRNPTITTRCLAPGSSTPRRC
jgi:hypothetical protein